MFGNKEKKFTDLILISVAVLVVGIVFKIMHWPHGSDIVIGAFAAILNLYFFRYWYKKKKILLDHIKLALVLFWCISGVFTVLHLPGKIFIQIIFGLLFIAFIILGGFNTIYAKASGTKPVVGFNFSNSLMSIAAVLTIIGTLFKVMHWPFGTYMLLAGLGLGIVWFLKDSFNSNNEE